MTDVFISYGRQDRERVRPMAEALQESGLDVWWDPDIPPGSDFRAETGRALKEATAVIVVWSQHSVTRHFVLDEASVALERGVLFPVLVDVVDIPLGFRQIQTVDLTKWRGKTDDAAFRSLIDAVARFVKAKAAPKPDGAPVREDTPAPASDAKFTVTGIGARLRLFWQAAIFATAVAIFIGIASAFLQQYIPGLEPENLDEFWYNINFFAVGAFIFTLLSRLLTFWADSYFGIVSLRLASRSYSMVFLTSLIAAAPIELHFQSSELLHPVSGISDAAFSPDDTRIVLATGYSEVEGVRAEIWSIANRKRLNLFQEDGWAIDTVTFDNTGTRIATSFRGTTADGARIWDAESGERIVSLKSKLFWENFASFSPDGTRLVIPVEDDENGIVGIWDTTNGENIRSFEVGEFPVASANYDWTGQLIVTASWDGARIWDAASGGKLRTFDLFSAGETRFADFNNDSSRIVTAQDSYASIWDAQTGARLVNLVGHGDVVNTARFSPSGLEVVTASRDGTAKIWDVTTGRELRSLDALLNDPSAILRFLYKSLLRGGFVGYGVNSAAYSADGSYIITSSDTGAAQLWNASTGEPILILRPSAQLPFFSAAPRLALPFLAPVRNSQDPSAKVDFGGQIILARSLGLFLAVMLLSASIRLGLRLFFKPEKLFWIRPTIFTIVGFYLAAVYLTNLSIGSTVIWIGNSFLLVPVLAFIRLLLAWEFKGAFASRV